MEKGTLAVLYTQLHALVDVVFPCGMGYVVVVQVVLGLGVLPTLKPAESQPVRRVESASITN